MSDLHSAAGRIVSVCFTTLETVWRPTRRISKLNLLGPTQKHRRERKDSPVVDHHALKPDLMPGPPYAPATESGLYSVIGSSRYRL